MSDLQALLQSLSNIEVPSLPRNVLKKAALVLADDLAAMVAGGQESEVRQLVSQRVARANVGPFAARVFCASELWLGPVDAAVLNAIGGCWCELDEGYRPLPCHAGLYALPAILAEAEIADVSTGDVLRALVGAYEFGTRVARAFHFEEMRIHPHSFFSAMVATVGVGLIRRVPVDQLEAGVTLAYSLCGMGPFNHATQGVLARNVWAAAGTWAGMHAMDWAAAGLAGSGHTLSELAVILHGASFDPAPMSQDLGEAWGIMDGYHKPFPCCQYTHSSIEASLNILAIRPDLIGGGMIQSIEVQTHPLALSLSDARPITSLGAKFSLPHAIAATLVHGSASPEAFSGNALRDPRIARLREIVSIALLPEIGVPPLDRPSQVRVTLTDRSTISAICPSAKGGVDRPMQTAEILNRAQERLNSGLTHSGIDCHAIHSLSDAVLGNSWASIAASK